MIRSSAILTRIGMAAVYIIGIAAPSIAAPSGIIQGQSVAGADLRPSYETAATTIMTSEEITNAAMAGRGTDASAPMISTPLFAQAPFAGKVEQRIAGTTPPSIHIRSGELFFVTDGSGTVVSGGELVNPVLRGNTIAGTAIRNGVTRVVNKGDLVYIPAGLPHQIADVKTTLTMVSVFLVNVTTPLSPPDLPPVRTSR